MKKVFIAILAFSLLTALAGIAIAKSQAYYVCNCGADCKCNTISATPGKCACGKDTVPMHLLAIDNGNTAVFCTCGADCSCKRDADNPDKCGCGHAVKKVSLVGKYVCACGADCNCGSISDKPGNCACGKPMKLVQ